MTLDKRDAEAFQVEQSMAFKDGRQRDKADEITLKVFCEDWLKTKKVEYRPETVKLYQNAIRRLLDYFGGNMFLTKITPLMAAKFIAALEPMKKDTRAGAKLSSWSMHRTLRNCKTIWNSAVTWELIAKNPFTHVSTPKLITRRWYYLKPKEYRKLLEVVPTLRHKAIYALAYTAGPRFGELFSLTWSDIDFETGEVVIENRPATASMPPFYVKDYEARRIPLPKHTLDILSALYSQAPEKVPYVLLDQKRYNTLLAKWKKHQQQKKPWRNQDIVNNVLVDFRRHLRWAGIKPIGQFSLHTLRKCCGQNWANHLPMNVVKELMGHSSIDTTQKFYNQVDEDHRAKAAAVIDKLVSETDTENEKQHKTDAGMTPRANFSKNSKKIGL